MSRIVLLNRRYCLGEAWTNRVLGYAKGLAEIGYHVDLCYLITDTGRTPYNIRINGVNVVNFWEKDNWLEKRFRFFSFIANYLRARRYIKSSDTVFIYGGERYLVNLAKRCHARVFVEITEHPYVNNTRNKHNIDKQQLFYKKIDGLVVISDILKGYYLSIGIPESKILRTNMFVDENRFKSIKKENSYAYIAYCGIISLNKDGVDVLLKAFSIFIENNPGFKLMLIGRFESDKTKMKLMRIVQQLCLSDKVEFTGQLPPNEVARLLVNARILALARPDNIQSRNGFPTKLGEYLSTKNPVVVTSVGEIPLFIKNGYNGYLARPGDPIDFSDKLSWVAHNYEEACIAANRGFELVNDEFSYLCQSQKLSDFIKK